MKWAALVSCVLVSGATASLSAENSEDGPPAGYTHGIIKQLVLTDAKQSLGSSYGHFEREENRSEPDDVVVMDRLLVKTPQQPEIKQEEKFSIVNGGALKTYEGRKTVT